MTQRQGTISGHRRGVALVTVMWVVLVSGLMLLGVVKAARTQRALSHGSFAALEAHWLARAGIEQAMAVLEEDDPAADSPLDKWFDNRELFENIELGSGSLSVVSAAEDNRPGLVDESSRINLNVADKQQLKELKTLSDSQIDALVDWRSGINPNDPGNKAGYYLALPFPYEMRGEDFQTHRELLQVHGFEDRKFFGDPGNPALAPTGPAAQTTVWSYQPAVAPAGQPRVNFNIATAQQLQERFNFTPGLAAGVVQRRSTGREYQNLTDLLDVQPQQGVPAAAPPNPSASGEPPVPRITLQWLAAHAEDISFKSEPRLPGKININTASHEVLMTLPGMNGELADRIINQRSAASGVFKSLGDLLERRVMEENVLRGLIDRLTVRSDVFSVESIGNSGGIQRRIFAVIDRGKQPMGIIYWYQTP